MWWQLLFTGCLQVCSWLLRAIAECFARLSYGLGVCVSVRPSHSAALSKRCKLRSRNFYCQLPWESGLSWQNFLPVSAGVLLERKRQKRATPLTIRYFAVIGSYSVKTVADRYRHAAYHNKHWWQAFYLCQRRWPQMTLNSQSRSC